MRRETRLNLIFLGLFLAISVPGAVILFLKKLEPDARRMALPDAVRRTGVFIDPNPLPRQIRRVVPPKTGAWVDELVPMAREMAGAGRVRPVAGEPMLSQKRLFQVIGLSASQVPAPGRESSAPGGESSAPGGESSAPGGESLPLGGKNLPPGGGGSPSLGGLEGVGAPDLVAIVVWDEQLGRGPLAVRVSGWPADGRPEAAARAAARARARVVGSRVVSVPEAVVAELQKAGLARPPRAVKLLLVELAGHGADGAADGAGAGREGITLTLAGETVADSLVLPDSLVLSGGRVAGRP